MRTAHSNPEVKRYSRRLIVKETNMVLKCDSQAGLAAAEKAVRANRLKLEMHIQANPFFLASFEPVDVDATAPPIVCKMAVASRAAGVGPMAAVAGAIAEAATDAMLLCECRFALAENGGDISLARGNATIGVFAGKSHRLTGALAFRLKDSECPAGICTSAGKVGHSISFGDTDATIVFSHSPALSDAAATAIANMVKETDPEGTLQLALEKADLIKGLYGCMVIIGDLIGTRGRIPELARIGDGLKLY